MDTRPIDEKPKVKSEFPRNKARYLRQHSRAKETGSVLDIHRNKFQNRLCTKLRYFRVYDDYYIKDTYFMDFMLWCYFIDAIDKMVLRAVARYNFKTFEDYMNADLDYIQRHNKQLERISWNTIKKSIDFKDKAKVLYEHYSSMYPEVDLYEQKSRV